MAACPFTSACASHNNDVITTRWLLRMTKEDISKNKPQIFSLQNATTPGLCCFEEPCSSLFFVYEGLFQECSQTFWELLCVPVTVCQNIGVNFWPEGQLWPTDSFNLTYKAKHNKALRWPTGIIQHNTQHGFRNPRCSHCRLVKTG